MITNIKKTFVNSDAYLDIYPVNTDNLLSLFFVLKKLGLTPHKAEELLHCLELQEKKNMKMKGTEETWLERTQRREVSINNKLKSFI